MDDDLTDSAKTTAPRPLRCAVYARVSVEDRQDAQMPVTFTETTGHDTEINLRVTPVRIGHDDQNRRSRSPKYAEPHHVV